jgi:transposase
MPPVVVTCYRHQTGTVVPVGGHPPHQIQRRADHRHFEGAPGGAVSPRAVSQIRDLGCHTFYNWRSRYGGLEVSEAKRLKALEDENKKLKKLLAESMLDVATLKEMLGKNF